MRNATGGKYCKVKRNEVKGEQLCHTTPKVGGRKERF